jgi:hypothetical protein
MNPVIPAPVPVPLPAPAWLLQFLLVFTFVLHVVPMNLLLGGSVLLAVSSWAGRRNPRHRELARRAAHALPPVVAFTITLGVAPLLFLQLLYGQLFYTSSVLMAWVWLAMVLLVLLGYYSVYWFSMQQEQLGRRAFWLIFVAALLFLQVAGILTQNMTLMLRPREFYGVFLSRTVGDYPGTFDAATLMRSLHFIVAALAVAGLGLALLAGRWRQEAPELAHWVRRYGVRLFMAGTGLQFVAGLAFLFSLPQEIRAMFLGADKLATALLVVAVVLAVVAMVATPRSLTVGTVTIVGTIGLMAILRHLLRAAYLRPYFDPHTLPVQSQWPVFALFVILLLGGLATVGWMLRVFFRPGARAASAPRGVAV